MASGVSGYFELAGTMDFKARIYYSEEYDLLSNSSVLTITDLQVQDNNWAGWQYFLNGRIDVNGKPVVSPSSAIGNLFVRPPKGNFTSVDSRSKLPPPWESESIPHNDDGSKSVTVSVQIQGFTSGGGGGSGWKIIGNEDIELATIPRESTIGATDANIGATSIIAVTRKANQYTHSIQYTFGSLGGYIDPVWGISDKETRYGATSIPFLIPESFYAQIPNAQSGKCTLICRTYSGNTLIGTGQTAEFKVTAAREYCAPEVSGSVEDGNADTVALTGDKSKLIRYASTAVCIISATSRNRSSIVQKAIDGEVITGDSRSIPAVERNAFLLSATDSRGYANQKTITANMIPYVKLSNNASASRNGSVSGDAKLYLSGDYYNGSFGAEDNALQVKYRVAGNDWVPVSPSITGKRYSVIVDLSGLDYRKSYNIEVDVSDKLNAKNKSIVLEAANPSFFWDKNKFQFEIPLRLAAGIEPFLYYPGKAEQTEDNFNAFLKKLLSGSSVDTILPITFTVNPAISENRYFGFVGAFGNHQHGGLLAWSYNGTVAHKELRNGVWSNTILEKYR